MTQIATDDPRVEQMRNLNQMIEQLMADMPPIETVPPEETRAARREGRGAFPAPERLDDVATDRTIRGRGGEIGLRVFTPEEVTGVYLHIHGGGWVLGENWQQDIPLWELAQRAKVAVASVEYRLAPEDPYPAGPDDCEDAALWLVEHAQEEFGTQRLAIGGESAGAHLAAVSMLRLRDRHQMTPFSKAVLTFGVFDLSLTPSVRNWGDRKLILTQPVMEWFVDCFVPATTDEERRDPEFSPLYANLEGLCPALFTVGTADPLLDDTLFMEARWRTAGNETELRVYPEAAHGFVAFPADFSTDAREASARFLEV